MANDKDKVKIALVLAIRELKPITFTQLFEMIDRHDLRLPALCRSYLTTDRIGRSGQYYIRDLMEAGLVETVDQQPLNLHAQLTTTAALDRIQDLFDLSLNGILRKSHDTIESNPIFGRPMTSIGGQPWGRIFVAMPFRDEMRTIYTDHIAQVAQRLKVSCVRGDDFTSTNSIVHEVWSAIYHAELLIVDCTGKNPNVFYELGIAHTLGKKAVLIAQSRDDFPFDVQHLRSLIYSLTPEGMQQFEAQLEKTIATELGITVKARIPVPPMPGES